MLLQRRSQTLQPALVVGLKTLTDVFLFLSSALPNLPSGGGSPHVLGPAQGFFLLFCLECVQSFGVFWGGICCKRTADGGPGGSMTQNTFDQVENLKVKELR